ncbi:AtpZ/AtpI family protein [Candidatus Parcubacteria bacterium]|nr:MAG: AtpZ/AtpI family protein [Candidatus Parcubacteria bacterium]
MGASIFQRQFCGTIGKVEKQRGSFKVWYAFSLAWQMGFIIAVPIGLFLLLGMWADKTLGTHPLLLLAGVLAGIVTTIYEVYHTITPLLEEKNKSHHAAN